jgi:hypothetical protein
MMEANPLEEHAVSEVLPAVQRPPGWQSQCEIAAESGIPEPTLVDWRGKGLLPRPARFFSRIGSAALYPPETAAMAERIRELRRAGRDTEEWAFRLWIDPRNFPAEIKPRLLKRLRRLKEAFSSASDKDCEQANRLLAGRNRFKAIRKKIGPDGLRDLMRWALFVALDKEPDDRLVDSGSPILRDIQNAFGLPTGAFPSVDAKLGIDMMSVVYLISVAQEASGEEWQQSRRDWRTLIWLAEAAEALDWRVIVPTLAPIMAVIVGEKPPPPSIAARRAKRIPDAISYLAGAVRDPDVRAVMLPALISFRRSPEHSKRITELLALAEWVIRAAPGAAL